MRLGNARTGAAPRQPAQITAGVAQGDLQGAGEIQVFVDGATRRVPYTGAGVATGQSVTLARMGGGRYTVQSLAGHWAPPAP